MEKSNQNEDRYEYFYIDQSCGFWKWDKKDNQGYWMNIDDSDIKSTGSYNIVNEHCQKVSTEVVALYKLGVPIKNLIGKIYGV